jgi:DNA-binding transcriptional LysR family regulator
MELRHVRYFVAVADSLSFTKGAEKLRIAQPSLTRQIKHLEEELGVQLLNRSNKRVTLTKEGEHFFAGARRLLSYSADIVASLHSLTEPQPAINIGYVPNPFQRALPASLASYEKEFPTVSINLFAMPSLEQVRSLGEGKIDLGFVGLLDPADAPGLEFQTVAPYKVVLVIPRDHRDASTKPIELKKLAPMLFISLSDRCYHGYGRWLRKTCEDAGFKPRIVQTADNEVAALQAVRSGLGVALLPEQIRNAVDEQMTIREVRPATWIGSATAWRRDNKSKELRAYVQALDRAREKILQSPSPRKAK